MSAANNLMNQDEFKYGGCNGLGEGIHYDQDLIEEDNEGGLGSDDELDTSKISLFTAEEN
jgi:hypothetical protein